MSSKYLIITNTIFIVLQIQFHMIHGANNSPLFPTMLVFGDSIVDTGNNNKLLTAIKCDFPPYGQDFVGRKATGRFSNGKVTTDFIASAIKLKELLPPYAEADNQDLLTGVSFASGGSGYDLLNAQLSLVDSMPRQLELFKEYKKRLTVMVGENKATGIINKSLYLICAGSNDIVFYFSNDLRSKEYDVPAYSDFLMQTASNFTQELVGLGAKKVAIFGTPPIGCIPSQRTAAGGESRNCAKDRNDLAQLFNVKLSREAQKLTSTLHGTRIAFVDIYPRLLDLVQNPQKHGFKETKEGCCGTGNYEVAILCNMFSKTCNNTLDYVFWDSYHPTEKANQYLVKHLMEKYLKYLV